MQIRWRAAAAVPWRPVARVETVFIYTWSFSLWDETNKKDAFPSPCVGLLHVTRSVWPWANNMFIYWVPSATDLAVLISLGSVSEVSGSFIFLGSTFEISWRFLSLVVFVRYLHILYYWLMYPRHLDVLCTWVMCQVLDVQRRWAVYQRRIVLCPLFPTFLDV